MRAICDTGAQVNLITTECVKRAGLSHQAGHMSVAGVGGTSNWKIRWKVCAVVCDRNGEPIMDGSMAFWELPQLMGTQPGEEQDNTAVVLQSGEQLADPDWYKLGKVDVILGVGTVLSLLTGPPRTLADILMVPTRLGVLVAGVSQIQSEAATEAICAMSAADDGKDELLEALRNLWEIDEIFEEPTQTPQDKWCEEEFERTVRQDEEGRYIVTIPIQPGRLSCLGGSREQALQRFYHLERQFARDTAYREWYVEYMRALFKAGYLQEALGPVPKGHPAYYIPHHE